MLKQGQPRDTQGNLWNLVLQNLLWMSDRDETILLSASKLILLPHQVLRTFEGTTVGQYLFVQLLVQDFHLQRTIF